MREKESKRDFAKTAHGFLRATRETEVDKRSADCFPLLPAL